MYSFGSGWIWRKHVKFGSFCILDLYKKVDAERDEKDQCYVQSMNLWPKPKAGTPALGCLLQCLRSDIQIDYIIRYVFTFIYICSSYQVERTVGKPVLLLCMFGVLAGFGGKGLKFEAFTF